ncbi:hypothetical protein ACFYZE_19170 [Streptomyces sp. NPDC001796]|uniref:hypothetical protein n=1 Tax=Streptomyces sp. NPDC001796 TaxID=3364609 RepID=UPI0036BB8C64
MTGSGHGDGAPTFTEQARRRQLIECTSDLVSARGGADPQEAADPWSAPGRRRRANARAYSGSTPTPPT